ncbi:PLDc N-terminal domain-containing protein [Ornithinimicrobium cavernae]|uniref:PLDc N-terminal domain-containing protein n=1 Tax=Ornithinimicrobium cavernae TaxID=2666047 RepID=UPI000D68D30E|nr:PLDc N-terminal domain-containing protein [Ornithinimicrobium cavernae]
MLRVVLSVAVLAFTVYCVVDVVQTEEERVRGLPKLVWLVVTLLVPLAGGISWLIAGRPRGILKPRPRPSGPRGPDDDPDFLRGI